MEESSGVEDHITNSQSQAVLLQILSIGGGIVGERVGMNEITQSNTFSKQAIYHLYIVIRNFSYEYFLVVFLVLSPIQ